LSEFDESRMSNINDKMFILLGISIVKTTFKY